ncbi:uncharacterized protein FIESC28_00773 [Fusarium coffeatum]|uniref:Bulb-type lectin domain-containing protein n=1 Tax=Fusarium coffeatum TaxID=231269 RepID=A0A366SB05_9HYPO|nr:uncharacterized protein FIESC28_00773 [Fusarium coffeatum]RBR26479.1 hypothetical protein FIESC28_00773 [Fusarium coffeatum]
MSTAIAEDLVGASLKALAKGAGEEAVSEICSSLMGSVFGGGDDSSAAADAKILDQLSQIMSSLSQVQDSLNRIEQAVAQVDLDVAAAAIQQQVSIINSTYDTYFDGLNGLAAAAKGTDPASPQNFAQYRDRLVGESINVKNNIPTNLNIIHGFIIDQDFLGKLATASSPGIDIVDFYSKVKLPLIKIAMVEIKGVHLLRLAGAANQDPRVDFPDAAVAIQRALSNMELQDQALPSAIGAETCGFVSGMLTSYPKPAPACISPLETRGLTFGNQNGDSTWYGSENAQLWHIEPANDNCIITDGSKVNAFRLLHVDSNKYLSIQTKPNLPIFNLKVFNLGAEDFDKAAIWNFHLTTDKKLQIQSQDYQDTYLTGVKDFGDDYQSLHYVYLAQDYGNRAKDTQTFVGNTYQGPVGDFWPGNVTEMHDGEYLIPGSYLYDNHQTYSFGFRDNKLGVWDIKTNTWKWDFGILVGMSRNYYLRFSNSGVLTLYHRSDALRAWGPPNRGGTCYVLGMSYGGSLLIETGEAMYGNWSSDKPDMVQLSDS